jgi:hypothetical protein
VPHRRLSQFGGAVSFAAIVGAVDERVRAILFWRCPTQVSGVDAAFVALAARMGGLVPVTWSWPVRGFANDAMRVLPLAINKHDAVAVAAALVWPRQAVVA